jgi:hypothetical protein
MGLLDAHGFDIFAQIFRTLGAQAALLPTMFGIAWGLVPFFCW